MATKSAVDSASLVLAVGKESVLTQRVIANVMVSARKVDANTVRIDIAANNEDAALELTQALSPSLFGELTVVVIAGLDGATDALADLLSSSISEIPENVRIIATHPGGVKGKKLLETLRKGGALEASCAELKGADLQSALVAEFKRHGRKATSEAIQHLQTSVGSGLGDLMAAVSQLCADVEENLIDGEAVARYYEGVSDVMGWQISDDMWNAKPVEVLEKLRWALESDSSSAIPLLIAISNGLRGLIKYASAPAGMSEGELAGLVGVPPWRLKFFRVQKQKWNPEQLAMAARLLTLADRASKGTVYEIGVPGGLSLEHSQTRYHIEKALMAIRPPAQK